MPSLLVFQKHKTKEQIFCKISRTQNLSDPNRQQGFSLDG